MGRPSGRETKMDREMNALETIIGLLFGVAVLLSMGVVFVAAIWFVFSAALAYRQYNLYRRRAAREFRHITIEAVDDLPSGEAARLFSLPVRVDQERGKDDG